MEKRDIKNPLTLIAIFAGVSEVAMTSVLPFLPAANQAIFMWFVMIYPSLLVSLFFYVLVWRREALYAPSDFKDDATWLAVMRDGERKILEKYPLQPAIAIPTDNSPPATVPSEDSIQKNPFYRFLRSLGLSHETVKSVATTVDKADDLPDFLSKQFGEDVANKVTRTLNEFESSKGDFYKLQKSLKEGVK